MDSLPLHPSHLKSENSWTSSKIPVKVAKPLPKSRPKTLKDPDTPKNDSQIRLSDLCPEDKAKVGELVKRLALEKSQREETENKLDRGKREKEKELKKMRKQNEKIRAEKEQLIAKYEKTLEILDTYKQNSAMQSSWKEWEKPKDEVSVLNGSFQSLNVTPEPQRIMSIAISPIKDTAHVSVQTVCDKGIQTADEELKVFELKKDEKKNSTAVNEIEGLKNDIFTLSGRLKSISACSLRASQNLGRRTEGEIVKNIIEDDDEKMKKLMERSEINTKRGNTLKQNLSSMEKFSDHSKKNSFDSKFSMNQLGNYKSLSPISEEKHMHGAKLVSKVPVKEPHEIITIEQGFYDENLFQLVDDLEKTEENYLELESFDQNHKYEVDSNPNYSSFSDFSSKHENSVDNFYEIQERALKLKKSLKH